MIDGSEIILEFHMKHNKSSVNHAVITPVCLQSDP